MNMRRLCVRALFLFCLRNVFLSVTGSAPYSATFPTGGRHCTVQALHDARMAKLCEALVFKESKRVTI